MWIVMAAAAVSLCLVTVTVWALWLTVAIVVGSWIDAGLRHRRLKDTITWSWLDGLLAFTCMLALSILVRVFVVEAFKIPSSAMSPTLEIGDHLFVNKLFGSPKPGDIIVFRQPCQPERDYIERVIAMGGDTIEVRCAIVYINGKPIPRDLVDGETCRYEDYDRETEWFWKDCSRYRETIGAHTFDIFHDQDRPKRETERKAGGEPPIDSKDFPYDELPRSCSNQPDGQPTGSSDQLPGNIVVTDPDPRDPCAPHMHFVVPEDSLFVMGDSRSNSNDSRFWGVVPASYVKGRVIGIWRPLSRFGSIR